MTSEDAEQIQGFLEDGELSVRQASEEIKTYCSEQSLSPRKVIEEYFSGFLSTATYHRHLAAIEVEALLELEEGSLPGELAVLMTPKKVDPEHLPQIWQSACGKKERPSKKSLIDAIQTHKDLELFKRLITKKGFLKKFLANLDNDEASIIKEKIAKVVEK